jgi:lipopolysaccharide transport system ATP-binding protein
MPQETLIQCEHVSKKFCRSLKRSLWYGIQGVLHSLNPMSDSQSDLDLVRPVTDEELRQDEFWSLQDISFELRRGECLGLIGHNGAGKSTLLKILNGLIRPDRGRITMRGRVAALIELNAGFNNLLTGRENIYNQAALLGFTNEEVKQNFDAIVDFAEIGDFLDMPVQNYSSGMRVRLGFAVSSQLVPDILIIDEVLAVGDTSFRFKCLNRMADIMKDTAVIFVSHSMQQIARVATQAMVLKHGKIAFNGTSVPDAVKTYYLSQSAGEPKVTGNGKAFISQIFVKSRNTMESGIGIELEYRGDEEITLELQVSVVQPLKQILVQGLLWTEDLVPAVELVSKNSKGAIIGLEPGVSKVDITLRIPPLKLNGGKYSLSLSAVSPDYREVYFRHDGILTLSVINPTVSHAVLMQECIWHTQNMSI